MAGATIPLSVVCDGFSKITLDRTSSDEAVGMLTLGFSVKIPTQDLIRSLVEFQRNHGLENESGDSPLGPMRQLLDRSADNLMDGASDASYPSSPSLGRGAGGKSNNRSASAPGRRKKDELALTPARNDNQNAKIRRKKQRGDGVDDEQSQNAAWTLSMAKVPKMWEPEGTKAGYTPLTQLNAVVWSPDGHKLATGRGDKDTRVWEATSTEPLLWGSVATVRANHGWITCVAWSPDSTQLVTGSVDTLARIWVQTNTHPVQWEVAFTLSGHEDALTAVSWSEDGSKIVTASSDKTARVWALLEDETDGPATWKTASVVEGHSDQVTAVVWSGDGHRLLTASGDKTSRIWESERDGAEWSLVATLLGHSDIVAACAWSPDESLVVTGSNDKTVHLWQANPVDPFKWAITATLKGHTARVTAVSFHADGKLIVTGSADNSILLWRPSGKSDKSRWDVQAKLTGHATPVTALNWCPDCVRLASGSIDGITLIWLQNKSNPAEWTTSGLTLASVAQHKKLKSQTVSPTTKSQVAANKANKGKS